MIDSTDTRITFRPSDTSGPLYLRCAACSQYFKISNDMMANPRMQAISILHARTCQGEYRSTLRWVRRLIDGRLRGKLSGSQLASSLTAVGLRGIMDCGIWDLVTIAAMYPEYTGQSASAAVSG